LPRKKAFYTGLSFQVLAGVAIAVILGYVNPAMAVSMKPLGDVFIRMITMIITLVIFCTLVTGIAGMEDMKKVGRVGGKALLYFELVSTMALLIGLLVGNLAHPGSGFNIDPKTLDARAVAEYAGQAKAQNITDFLVHIIPNTVVDAFSKGDILQVLLVSVLFGFALSIAGPRCKPLLDVMDSLTRAVFGVGSDPHALRPNWRFWRDGFHHWKVRAGLVGPAGKINRHALHHVHLFRSGGAGTHRALCRLRNSEVFVVYSGRNSARSGHQFFRARPAESYGQAPEVGLLEGPRRPGGSNRLHIQRGRHKPVHDARRPVRCSSDRHTFDADSAIHNSRSRSAHFEGRQRRTGSRLHRSSRHDDGDSNHPRRRNGPDPRNRSFSSVCAVQL